MSIILNLGVPFHEFTGECSFCNNTRCLYQALGSTPSQKHLTPAKVLHDSVLYPQVSLPVSGVERLLFSVFCPVFCPLQLQRQLGVIFCSYHRAIIWRLHIYHRRPLKTQLFHIYRKTFILLKSQPPNLHLSHRRLFRRLIPVNKQRLRRIAPIDRIVFSDISIKSSIRQIAAIKRQAIKLTFYK